MTPRLMTVVETALFQRQASAVRKDEEREQFVNFIALRSPALPADGLCKGKAGKSAGGREACVRKLAATLKGEKTR